MKRIIVILLVAVLAMPLFMVAPDVVSADSGSSWIGEYFTNPNVQGTPIYVRLDDTISFNWGGSSPYPGLVPADGFSARWTGVQQFDGGMTTFTATSDDGVRVWVDDQLVIDAWYDQLPTTHTGQRNLTAGSHYVRVEYYDSGDQASISVSWLPENANTGSGWEAAYFNGISLQAPQDAGRLEAAIDYNWGAGSPFPGQIDENSFSARWRGYPVLEGGSYTFVAGADDGIRVVVDGQMIIDEWSATTYHEVEYTMDLSAGQHLITVEYYEAGAQAQVSFYWVYNGPAGSVAATDVTATINTGRLNVRSGPGVSYGIIVQVINGETYPVIGVNAGGNWYKIQGTGWAGWISGAYAVIEGSGDLPVLTADAPDVPDLQARSLGSVRVRRGPGTDQPRVAAFNYGQTAEIIGRNAAGDWVQIRISDGTEGWVYDGAYVVVEGNISLESIPITG